MESRMLFILFSIVLYVNGENTDNAMITASFFRDTYFYRYISAEDGMYTLRKFPIIAAASFENKINETGWSALTVMTSNSFPSEHQAYWAGYLETNLTHELTSAHYTNTVKDLCPKPLSSDCMKLKQYLADNIQQMIMNSVMKSAEDPFWYQVYLQLWQLKGISDAFKGNFLQNSTGFTKDYLSELSEDVLGIYLLQLSGDLFDLVSALSLKSLFNRPNQLGHPTIRPPSCSMLVKFLGYDIYFSHVTWSPYSDMLRVIKSYQFPWKQINSNESISVPGTSMTFTSYPSTISSIDDFYVISTGLAVSETTIGMNNKTLLQIIRDGFKNSVFTFLRVMTANRLAVSGKDWVAYFEQHNSGTYNNEWVILDSKLFVPGQPLPTSGLLTLADQLPGILMSRDITSQFITQSYWASYNLPFIPEIYNISGMNQMRDQHGDWYSYEETARAKIFRRDHHKVDSLQTMHDLMRYNDFRHDNLSQCNCTPPYTAENGIAARNDLNDPNGTYALPAFGYRLHGATDAKIVNLVLLQDLNMLATSGPTYTHLPIFEWSKLPIPVKKPLMHPDKFMFAPIITNFTNYCLRSSENYHKLSIRSIF